MGFMLFIVSCRRESSDWKDQSGGMDSVAMEYSSEIISIDGMEYLTYAGHKDFIHPAIEARLKKSSFHLQRLTQKAHLPADNLFRTEEIPVLRKKEFYIKVMRDGRSRFYMENARIENEVPACLYVCPLKNPDFSHPEFCNRQKYPNSDVGICFSPEGNTVIEQNITDGQFSSFAGAFPSGSTKLRTECDPETGRVVKMELFAGEYLVGRKIYSYSETDSLQSFWGDREILLHPVVIDSYFLSEDTGGYPVIRHIREVLKKKSVCFF